MTVPCVGWGYGSRNPQNRENRDSRWESPKRISRPLIKRTDEEQPLALVGV
ncbi:MAG: hypothetical protein MPL62_03860 [Alphaproteobacteria bacterium]|nr:hypothetical protein [Alphaproteobacteria bacterium]